MPLTVTMDSGSPTTTSSTNRGGRPKDWTDTRVRKLIRLYTYTRLSFGFILDILETLDDGVWKPGKDAANKVKNALLGNDPRWIRPKDAEDEEKRITGLKNSRRAKNRLRRTTSYATPDLENFSLPQYPGAGFDGVPLTHSYHPSSEKVDEVPISPWDFRDTNAHFNGGPSLYSVSTHDDASKPWFSQGPFTRFNTSRQGTGLTSSTDISMNSGIRAKLSSLPKTQAKDIMRLVKRFTLEKNSETQQSPITSPSGIPNLQFQSPTDDLQAQHELATQDVQDARHAVPGDFLKTDLFTGRLQCSARSSSHEAGTCWCRIAAEISQVRGIWASLGTLPDISYPGLESRDPFGNTVFHHFATLDGIHNSFIRFVSHALQRPDLPICATNTAGQTFLHVLHSSWFADGPRFRELLRALENTRFNIFATDVYGRNVFHLLRNRMGDSARFPQHTHEWNSLNRRDAFGVKPMALRAWRNLDPNVAQTSQPVGIMDTMDLSRTDSPLVRISIPSENEDTTRIRQNTALLELINSASSIENPNPLLEDSHGRNGLHCLAEVDLDIGPLRTSSSSSRQSKKRKYGEDDDAPSPQSRQSSRRLQYLQGLLHAKLDVNHYDENGYTPLMAFVTHGRDDSRWEKNDLEKMIRMLVRTGGANMEARNREGETALHIAARRGQKVALKELLELGANPNVRNAQGLGILAVIDEFYRHTERDGVFGARLEVCRCLLTGRASEPVLQEPTVLAEWAMRQEELTL
ncbi:hypothetical protein F5X99DRAFT_396907 [Biscogniauxia marginata]|nr:hypothetical protein F5X99DRAFT_396907 [Biscogniauxia marginata]